MNNTTFARTVCHELKNHFAFENVIADLIQNEFVRCHEEYASKLEDVITTYCGKLKEHSRKGQAFVDQMLSQANGGERAKQNMVDMNLRDAINDAMTELETRIHNKLEISIDIPTDYSVYANAVMLEHIFLNLIENANHAMKADNGKLEIFLSEDQQTICVKDNGQGISPEVLPQIFDQGFTTKATGTGTGLALCKNLMEDMGGNIQCESQVGEGACFKLSFSR